MSAEDSPPTSPPPSACPVDHKSREVWLKAAQQQQQQQVPMGTSTNSDTGTPIKRPRFTNTRTLSTDRQVSSIPRGSLTSASPPTSGAAAAESASHGSSSQSPNAETSNPTTSTTGNWLYPSEAQFFQAVIRKRGPSLSSPDQLAASTPSSTDVSQASTSAATTSAGISAQPSDMKTIIPLHNAINERTWQQILAWERGRGGERCGGPKLVSFSGDSTKLTPRARWLGLLGYTRPFDRHDWVVERCGMRVEYVIDFYQGRAQTKQHESGVNFYLDVRPKLNSWEGWKMRIGRVFGL